MYFLGKLNSRSTFASSISPKRYNGISLKYKRTTDSKILNNSPPDMSTDDPNSEVLEIPTFPKNHRSRQRYRGRPNNHQAGRIHHAGNSTDNFPEEALKHRKGNLSGVSVVNDIKVLDRNEVDADISDNGEHPEEEPISNGIKVVPHSRHAATETLNHLNENQLDHLGGVMDHNGSNLNHTGVADDYDDMVNPVDLLTTGINGFPQPKLPLKRPKMTTLSQIGHVGRRENYFNGGLRPDTTPLETAPLETTPLETINEQQNGETFDHGPISQNIHHNSHPSNRESYQDIPQNEEQLLPVGMQGSTPKNTKKISLLQGDHNDVAMEVNEELDRAEQMEDEKEKAREIKRKQRIKISSGNVNEAVKNPKLTDKIHMHKMKHMHHGRTHGPSEDEQMIMDEKLEREQQLENENDAASNQKHGTKSDPLEDDEGDEISIEETSPHESQKSFDDYRKQKTEQPMNDDLRESSEYDPTEMEDKQELNDEDRKYSNEKQKHKSKATHDKTRGESEDDPLEDEEDNISVEPRIEDDGEKPYSNEIEDEGGTGSEVDSSKSTHSKDFKPSRKESGNRLRGNRMHKGKASGNGDTRKNEKKVSYTGHKHSLPLTDMNNINSQNMTHHYGNKTLSVLAPSEVIGYSLHRKSWINKQRPMKDTTYTATYDNKPCYKINIRSIADRGNKKYRCDHVDADINDNMEYPGDYHVGNGNDELSNEDYNTRTNDNQLPHSVMEDQGIGVLSDDHHHAGVSEYLAHPNAKYFDHGIGVLSDDHPHAGTSEQHIGHSDVEDQGIGVLSDDHHHAGVSGYLAHPNANHFDHGIGVLSDDHHHAGTNEHHIGHSDVEDQGIGVLSDDHHHAGVSGYHARPNTKHFDHGIGVLSDDHHHAGASEHHIGHSDVEDQGIGVLSDDHHHAGVSGYLARPNAKHFDHGIGVLSDDHHHAGTNEHYIGHSDVEDQGIGVLSEDHHHAGVSGYLARPNAKHFDHGIGVLSDDHHHAGTNEHHLGHSDVEDQGIGVLSDDHHHAGVSGYLARPNAKHFDHGIGVLSDDHHHAGTNEHHLGHSDVEDQGIGVLSDDHHHAGVSGYLAHPNTKHFDHGIGVLSDDHHHAGASEHHIGHSDVEDQGIGVLSDDHHHAGVSGYLARPNAKHFDHGIGVLSDDHHHAGTSEHHIGHSDVEDQGIGVLSDDHHHAGVSGYLAHHNAKHFDHGIGVLSDDHHHAGTSEHHIGHSDVEDQGIGVLSDDHHHAGVSGYLARPNAKYFDHGIGVLSDDHHHAGTSEHHIGHSDVEDQGIGVLTDDHHHAGVSGYLAHPNAKHFDHGIGVLSDDHHHAGTSENHIGHSDVEDQGIGVLSDDHHHAGVSGYLSPPSHKHISHGIGVHSRRKYGSRMGLKGYYKHNDYRKSIIMHNLAMQDNIASPNGKNQPCYKINIRSIRDDSAGMFHCNYVDADITDTIQYPGDVHIDSDIRVPFNKFYDSGTIVNKLPNSGTSSFLKGHNPSGVSGYFAHPMYNHFDNGIGIVSGNHYHTGASGYQALHSGIADQGIGVLSDDHHHAGVSGYLARPSAAHFDHGIGVLSYDHHHAGTSDHPAEDSGIADHGIGVLSGDHHHAGVSGYLARPNAEHFDHGIGLLSNDHHHAGTSDHQAEHSVIVDDGIGTLRDDHNHADLTMYHGIGVSPKNHYYTGGSDHRTDKGTLSDDHLHAGVSGFFAHGNVGDHHHHQNHEMYIRNVQTNDENTVNSKGSNVGYHKYQGHLQVRRQIYSTSDGNIDHHDKNMLNSHPVHLDHGMWTLYHFTMVGDPSVSYYKHKQDSKLPIVEWPTHQQDFKVSRKHNIEYNHSLIANNSEYKGKVHTSKLKHQSKSQNYHHLMSLPSLIINSTSKHISDVNGYKYISKEKPAKKKVFRIREKAGVNPSSKLTVDAHISQRSYHLPACLCHCHRGIRVLSQKYHNDFENNHRGGNHNNSATGVRSNNQRNARSSGDSCRHNHCEHFDHHNHHNDFAGNCCDYNPCDDNDDCDHLEKHVDHGIGVILRDHHHAGASNDFCDMNICQHLLAPYAISEICDNSLCENCDDNYHQYDNHGDNRCNGCHNHGDDHCDGCNNRGDNHYVHCHNHDGNHGKSCNHHSTGTCNNICGEGVIPDPKHHCYHCDNNCHSCDEPLDKEDVAYISDQLKDAGINEEYSEILLKFCNGDRDRNLEAHSSGNIAVNIEHGRYHADDKKLGTPLNPKEIIRNLVNGISKRCFHYCTCNNTSHVSSRMTSHNPIKHKKTKLHKNNKDLSKSHLSSNQSRNNSKVNSNVPSNESLQVSSQILKHNIKLNFHTFCASCDQDNPHDVELTRHDPVNVEMKATLRDDRNGNEMESLSDEYRDAEGSENQDETNKTPERVFIAKGDNGYFAHHNDHTDHEAEQYGINDQQIGLSSDAYNHSDDNGYIAHPNEHYNHGRGVFSDDHRLATKDNQVEHSDEQEQESGSLSDNQHHMNVGEYVAHANHDQYGHGSRELNNDHHRGRSDHQAEHYDMEDQGIGFSNDDHHHVAINRYPAHPDNENFDHRLGAHSDYHHDAGTNDDEVQHSNIQDQDIDALSEQHHAGGYFADRNDAQYGDETGAAAHKQDKGPSVVQDQGIEPFSNDHHQTGVNRYFEHPNCAHYHNGGRSISYNHHNAGISDHHDEHYGIEKERGTSFSNDHYHHPGVSGYDTHPSNENYDHGRGDKLIHSRMRNQVINDLSYRGGNRHHHHHHRHPAVSRYFVHPNDGNNEYRRGPAFNGHQHGQDRDNQIDDPCRNIQHIVALNHINNNHADDNNYSVHPDDEHHETSAHDDNGRIRENQEDHYDIQHHPMTMNHRSDGVGLPLQKHHTKDSEYGCCGKKHDIHTSINNIPNRKAKKHFKKNYQRFYKRHRTHHIKPLYNEMTDNILNAGPSWFQRKLFNDSSKYVDINAKSIPMFKFNSNSAVRLVYHKEPRDSCGFPRMLGCDADSNNRFIDQGIGSLSNDHHHAGTSEYPGHMNDVVDRGIGMLNADHIHAGITRYPGSSTEGPVDYGIGEISSGHHQSGTSEYPGHMNDVVDHGIGKLNADHNQAGSTRYPGSSLDHSDEESSVDNHQTTTPEYTENANDVDDHDINMLNAVHDQGRKSRYPTDFKDDPLDHRELSVEHHQSEYPDNINDAQDHDMLNENDNHARNIRYPDNSNDTNSLDHDNGELSEDHSQVGASKYPGHLNGKEYHNKDMLNGDEANVGNTIYHGKSTDGVFRHAIDDQVVDNEQTRSTEHGGLTEEDNRGEKLTYDPHSVDSWGKTDDVIVQRVGGLNSVIHGAGTVSVDDTQNGVTLHSGQPTGINFDYKIQNLPENHDQSCCTERRSPINIKHHQKWRSKHHNSKNVKKYKNGGFPRNEHLKRNNIPTNTMRVYLYKTMVTDLPVKKSSLSRRKTQSKDEIKERNNANIRASGEKGTVISYDVNEEFNHYKQPSSYIHVRDMNHGVNLNGVHSGSTVYQGIASKVPFDHGIGELFKNHQHAGSTVYPGYKADYRENLEAINAENSHDVSMLDSNHVYPENIQDPAHPNNVPYEDPRDIFDHGAGELYGGNHFHAALREKPEHSTIAFDHGIGVLNSGHVHATAMDYPGHAAPVPFDHGIGDLFTQSYPDEKYDPPNVNMKVQPVGPIIERNSVNREYSKGMLRDQNVQVFSNGRLIRIKRDTSNETMKKHRSYLRKQWFKYLHLKRRNSFRSLRQEISRGQINDENSYNFPVNENGQRYLEIPQVYANNVPANVPEYPGTTTNVPLNGEIGDIEDQGIKMSNSLAESVGSKRYDLQPSGVSINYEVGMFPQKNELFETSEEPQDGRNLRYNSMLHTDYGSPAGSDYQSSLNMPDRGIQQFLNKEGNMYNQIQPALYNHPIRGIDTPGFTRSVNNDKIDMALPKLLDITNPKQSVQGISRNRIFPNNNRVKDESAYLSFIEGRPVSTSGGTHTYGEASLVPGTGERYHDFMRDRMMALSFHYGGDTFDDNQLPPILRTQACLGKRCIGDGSANPMKLHGNHVFIHPTHNTNHFHSNHPGYHSSRYHKNSHSRTKSHHHDNKAFDSSNKVNDPNNKAFISNNNIALTHNSQNIGRIPTIDRGEFQQELERNSDKNMLLNYHGGIRDQNLNMYASNMHRTENCIGRNCQSARNQSDYNIPQMINSYAENDHKFANQINRMMTKKLYNEGSNNIRLMNTPKVDGESENKDEKYITEGGQKGMVDSELKGNEDHNRVLNGESENILQGRVQKVFTHEDKDLRNNEMHLSNSEELVENNEHLSGEKYMIENQQRNNPENTMGRNPTYPSSIGQRLLGQSTSRPTNSENVPGKQPFESHVEIGSDNVQSLNGQHFGDNGIAESRHSHGYYQLGNHGNGMVQGPYQLGHHAVEPLHSQELYAQNHAVNVKFTGNEIPQEKNLLNKNVAVEHEHPNTRHQVDDHSIKIGDNEHDSEFVDNIITGNKHNMKNLLQLANLIADIKLKKAESKQNTEVENAAISNVNRNDGIYTDSKREGGTTFFNQVPSDIKGINDDSLRQRNIEVKQMPNADINQIVNTPKESISFLEQAEQSNKHMPDAQIINIDNNLEGYEGKLLKEQEISKQIPDNHVSKMDKGSDNNLLKAEESLLDRLSDKLGRGNSQRGAKVLDDILSESQHIANFGAVPLNLDNNALEDSHGNVNVDGKGSREIAAKQPWYTLSTFLNEIKSGESPGSLLGSSGQPYTKMKDRGNNWVGFPGFSVSLLEEGQQIDKDGVHLPESDYLLNILGHLKMVEDSPHSRSWHNFSKPHLHSDTVVGRWGGMVMLTQDPNHRKKGPFLVDHWGQSIDLSKRNLNGYIFSSKNDHHGYLYIPVTAITRHYTVNDFQHGSWSDSNHTVLTPAGLMQLTPIDKKNYTTSTKRQLDEYDSQQLHFTGPLHPRHFLNGDSTDSSSLVNFDNAENYNRFHDNDMNKETFGSLGEYDWNNGGTYKRKFPILNTPSGEMMLHPYGLHTYDSPLGPLRLLNSNDGTMHLESPDVHIAGPLNTGYSHIASTEAKYPGDLKPGQTLKTPYGPMKLVPADDGHMENVGSNSRLSGCGSFSNGCGASDNVAAGGGANINGGRGSANVVGGVPGSGVLATAVTTGVTSPVPPVTASALLPAVPSAATGKLLDSPAPAASPPSPVTSATPAAAPSSDGKIHLIFLYSVNMNMFCS